MLTNTMLTNTTRTFARILPNQCNMIRILDKYNTAYVPFQCTNEDVIIHNGTDAYLVYEFPKAKTVIFNNCDANFLYYNFTKQKFPMLETFYTNTHPCGPTVLARFADKPEYQSYLTSNYYKKYLNRWWVEDTHYINEISEFNYDAFLGSVKQESPDLELNINCNDLCNGMSVD